jgi:hypothetical protein
LDHETRDFGGFRRTLVSPHPKNHETSLGTEPRFPFLALPAKGKEYFDVFYGIEPLAWAFCGFVIVYYGAVLKNAATKYNIPVDKTRAIKVETIQLSFFCII